MGNETLRDTNFVNNSRNIRIIVNDLEHKLSNHNVISRFDIDKERSTRKVVTIESKLTPTDKRRGKVSAFEFDTSSLTPVKGMVSQGI